MKKLLLILLCVPLIGMGQSWEKTLGTGWYGEGESVQQTTDGGYIIAGYRVQVTGSQTELGFLIKTDGNGNELWSQTFGGTSYNSFIRSVVQTTDGGYIMTGETGQNRDVWLLKTDGNGDSLWSQTFGGTEWDEGHSVQQTTDGGYIITGTTRSFGNAGGDIFLIKTDGNGIEQWNQTFGGTDLEQGYSVQQTSDGGYIITGYTRSFGNGDQYVYLIKTDGNGIEQWSQTFGGTSSQYGHSLQQTTDGGYIITGAQGDGSSENDVYLIKTDGNGIEQWSQTFDGTSYQFGNSVQQTTDGGYIITGGTGSFDFSGDVWLLKTDGSGVEQWSQTFGGTEQDEGKSVQQTTDGGYIITGYNNPGWYIYLIKTDVNGNVTSEFSIPINSNRELKKVVDILGRDINPEKNKPFIEIYKDGTVEKKIIIE